MNRSREIIGIRMTSQRFFKLVLKVLEQGNGPEWLIPVFSQLTEKRLVYLNPAILTLCRPMGETRGYTCR